jgi:hypothetical protein
MKALSCSVVGIILFAVFAVLQANAEEVKFIQGQATEKSTDRREARQNAENESEQAAVTECFGTPPNARVKVTNVHTNSACRVENFFAEINVHVCDALTTATCTIADTSQPRPEAPDEQ